MLPKDEMKMFSFSVEPTRLWCLSAACFGFIEHKFTDVVQFQFIAHQAAIYSKKIPAQNQADRS